MGQPNERERHHHRHRDAEALGDGDTVRRASLCHAEPAHPGCRSRSCRRSRACESHDEARDAATSMIVPLSNKRGPFPAPQRCRRAGRVRRHRIGPHRQSRQDSMSDDGAHGDRSAGNDDESRPRRGSPRPSDGRCSRSCSPSGRWAHEHEAHHYGEHDERAPARGRGNDPPGLGDWPLSQRPQEDWSWRVWFGSRRQVPLGRLVSRSPNRFSPPPTLASPDECPEASVDLAATRWPRFALHNGPGDPGRRRSASARRAPTSFSTLATGGIIQARTVDASANGVSTAMGTLTGSPPASEATTSGGMVARSRGCPDTARHHAPCITPERGGLGGPTASVPAQAAP